MTETKYETTFYCGECYTHVKVTMAIIPKHFKACCLYCGNETKEVIK